MLTKIFIGYDENEHENFNKCVASIINTSVSPFSIIPLTTRSINFYNENKIDGTSQFTYTRFLVPYLSNFKGISLYLDSDTVVLENLKNLEMLISDNHAVSVVKHNYISKYSIKKTNQKNFNYPRKNWSSVIVWNCEHPSNKILTPNYVLNSTGETLHRFRWLKDEEIFPLQKEWNWLVGEYDSNKNAKILHYTLGQHYEH